MAAIIGTWRMCFGGLSEAAALLAGSACAGDAVERAITRVEDEPAYMSVGYGGLPARDGHVLLDAGYMDGVTLRYGGVQLDDSIRARLDKLRRSLSDTIV